MKIKLFLLFIFLILFSFIAYAATLTVNYNATNAELCKKFCVYKNVGSEYTVGLGSPTAKNISDGMSLTATITDANDDMYIILTKPNIDVSNREAFLKEKTFSDLINPSFGYPIIDIFSILIGLQYTDIYLKSIPLEGGIGPGLYSLVLRNNGTISSGPGAGSTEVIVEVI